MATIHGHSFRVESVLSPLGSRKLKNTPYLGVELELEFHRQLDAQEKIDLTDRTIELLGADFAMCKKDGSLRDGVEIVSAPATFPVQVQRWAEFLDGIGRGYVARSNCGMHVHVTRNMSNAVIGKMLYFLYHNQDAPNNYVDTYEFGAGQSSNCSWLCALAGRSCNDYGEIYSANLSQLERTPDLWALDDFYERYAALNVRSSKTIEFRLFASTLDKSRFMRRLEFVSAFVRWARSLNANAATWTRANFCKFALEAESRYPYLAEWIKSRKRFVEHENGWNENTDGNGDNATDY